MYVLKVICEQKICKVLSTEYLKYWTQNKCMRGLKSSLLDQEVNDLIYMLFYIFIQQFNISDRVSQISLTLS